MKKAFSILLSLVLILSALPLTAVNSFAETSGDWQYSVSGGKATITRYKGTAKVVSIPSTIDGYTVISIGYKAFYGSTSLTSVTISDSVTNIGDNAFYGCSSLTSITIPDSVTSIGEQAFSECSSLTSISIPDNVTSIDDLTFSGCTSLTSITIPDSVTSICRYAFYGCNSLTSVSIPDNVTSIGDEAFSGCSSLTSITIPDSVTSIGWYAFNSCSSLTSITIPDSVTSIGNGAFGDCPSLESIKVDVKNTAFDSRNNCNAIIESATNKLISGCDNTVIPDSVTRLGNYAFYCCSSLESITIPDSVTSIGECAFSGCSSLTSITIPDSVTSIGRAAFSYCSSLESITIPDSVTSIGDYAFGGCDWLTIYANTGSCAQRFANNNGIHFVSTGIMPFKLNYSVKNDGTVTISGYNGYADNVSIPSTIDGYNVTSISSRAFEYCTYLTSITIPESITSIDDYAFYCCYSLETIYGYTGSTAEEFANKKGLEFVSLGRAYKGFPDVGESAWYFSAVQYNAERGYITGYSNGKFGPADNLKRQDFVVILARIAGVVLDSYKNSTGGLKDVVKGSYYAPAVAWAVDNEIVTGYANGKFGVGDNITREQVATILYRYMGEPPITATVRNSVLSPYTDKNAISSYAQSAVAWAVKNGVISGKNATTLAPTATASRAEIATIIMRMDQQGLFALIN